MAYLCPVCEEPQVDAGHLANHLAFTALIRGGDHGAWLDEHVPDWDDHDESWLAERVREAIPETDHPVDEIETGGHGGTGHDHAHGGGHARGRGRGGASARDPTVAADAVEGAEDLDGDARTVVEEARELTRRMAAGESGDDADAPADTEGGASTEGETE